MIYAGIESILPNPWQTRRQASEVHIAELAADIVSRKASRPDTRGLLQVPAGRLIDKSGAPLRRAISGLRGDICKYLANFGYQVQLAYGHNRLAAFRLLAEQDADYRLMPVDLVVFTDEEMATAAWSENAARKDLTAVEEGLAIQQMMTSFNWSQVVVAERLGLSAATISNKLRLLRLPDQVQAAVLTREISERQAMAMLPVFVLPAPAFERASDCYHSPVALVEAAVKGDNSDRLRDRVESTIKWATVELAKAAFPLTHAHAFEGEGIRAAQCDECPERVTFKRAMLCPDRDCFKRKEELWMAHRLAAAMTATGLPALPEQVEYDERIYFEEHDYRLVREIQEEGCPRGCLRLKYDDGGYGVRLAEFPDVRLVCHHEGSKRCECLAGKKAKATRERNENDPEETARRERERQVKKLIEPAYQALGLALLEGHVGAWLALLTRLDYLYGGKGKNWSLEQITHQVAAQMLRSKLSWCQDQPEQARTKIVEYFKAAGLPLPWGDWGDESALAQIAARIERVAGWVSGQEGDDPPTLQAIDGNMANLSKIATALSGMREASEEREALTLRVAELISDLMEMRNGVTRQRGGDE